jgi:uncharacterized membrane protein
LTPEIQIRLAPNCSLDARGASWFFASCCLASFGVAILMALHGWWPVLPFAGFEMLLLAYALRTTLRRGGILELICIDASDVRIERHDRAEGHPQLLAVFPRHWSQVKLLRAANPHHPSRLLIASHGRSLEVGCFLTEDERLGLARRLRELIGTVNQSPPLAGPA